MAGEQDSNADSIGESLKEIRAHLEILEKREKKASSTSAWAKFLGPGITLFVIISTAIGGWYTNKSSVFTLQQNYVKVDSRIGKLEETIHDVELRFVEEKSGIKAIKEDLEELKQDVKFIRNRLGGN